MQINKKTGVTLIISDMEESEVRNLIDANKDKISHPETLKDANIRKCNSGVAVFVYCGGGQFTDIFVSMSELMDILTQLKPQIKYRIKRFAYEVDPSISVEENW